MNGSMTSLLSAHGTMSACPATAMCASMVGGGEASLLGGHSVENMKSLSAEYPSSYPFSLLFILLSLG